MGIVGDPACGLDPGGWGRGDALPGTVASARYRSLLRPISWLDNTRGTGCESACQGNFDHGTGELSDAAAALDWAQTINPEAKSCWIAGFSFGAWIGMQLLMRRPEIEGFISIVPPANLYDFSFLAPCPSSGLIIHGDKDAVVPPKDVTTLVDKLKTQKGIVIEQKVIPGANHFFDGKVEPLLTNICAYLDKRLKTDRKPTAA